MIKEEVDDYLSTFLELNRSPSPSPSAEDWQELRSVFATNFSAEFIAFMELITKYDFPGWILDVRPSSSSIVEEYNLECSYGRWNADMIPFYSIGNGDYYCLSAQEGEASGVYYADHEDASNKCVKPSFADWLSALKELALDE